MGVIASLIPTTQAFAEEVLIEDFETSSPLQRWSFSNGPEFPGAKGALTLIQGEDGRASRLSYDLTEGGNYVSATLEFPQALSTQSVAFWVREPARSQAKLRLYDAQGQVFEYSIRRPLEAFAPGMWFRSIVDVQASTGFFGGPDDGKLRMPLSGLSILAIPEFETVGAETGSIDFDNVSSLDEYRLEIVPDDFPLIPAPVGAAELAPRLGVNIRADDGERAIELAQAAGFGVVRVDLGWSDIETVRGVYDFTRFDALLEKLNTRSMRLHLILDYLNPLYPDLSAQDFERTTLAGFSTMARETARHFRGKQISYEIWNEPNSPTFWTRSTADFAALSSATAQAVHAGDPDALVCTGGLSGFDYRFAQEFLALGGAEGAEAMGVHPYRKGGGETIGHDLVLMRAVVEDARGAGLPLWQTEWGYSSSWYGDGHSATARARQANLVTRELLSAWAMGFPLIVYYNLRDGGTNPDDAEHNFGLLQDDYADKPAMAAVRTLTQVASNRQYVGLLQTSLSSLHALRLNGRSDLVLAVWWDDANRPVDLGLPAGASVRDLLGRAIATESTQKTTFTLRETDGPIYLTLNTETNSSGGSGGRASASSSHTGGTRATNSGGSGGSHESFAGDYDGPKATSHGCSCRTPVSREWHLFPVLLALATAGALRRRQSSARH